LSTRVEGAGSTTSTVTSSRSADSHGSYEINGYVLTLTFFDGRTERRMIVTDPTDLKVIWLDGEGYARQ
jgi:hypothetical protein